MFWKIGHRGAAGLEPENTIRSFKKALDLGVDAIEFDIHCLKSGKLVVIHDKKLNRTTDGKGRIKEVSLSYLKSLNAGRGEEISLLEEVLDLINKRAVVIIEIKSKRTARRAAEVIKKYVKEKNWSYDDFLVISFKQDELKQFKKVLPKVKMGLLIRSYSRGYMPVARNLKVFSVHPSLSLVRVRKGIIKSLQAEGFRVFVWTVNRKRNIKKLKKLGADGVVSDFPNRF